MIYKFNITFKQQFLMLIQPICAYVFIFASIYFFYKELSFIILEISIIFIFFTDTLPALILHVQYLLKNNATLLLIDEVNRTFTYKDSKKKIENMILNDINSLEYYSSSVRNTGIYSFARYRYCKIILKNGEEFIITCLMVNDIEDTLELLLHIKSENKLKVMCLI